MDSRTYNKKEQTERLRKTLSKITHRRAKRIPQKYIPRGKIQVSSSNKKEKLNSWQEYCNLTSSSNPWNTIYKIATNKHKRSLSMTTLLKPDGANTSNLNETVQATSDHLITRETKLTTQTVTKEFLRK